MDLDFDSLPADEEPTAPFWMATFSDMVTLLLAFFVMLVAMSSVEVKKFEEALSYFTGRRGVLENDGLMPGVVGIVAEQTAQDEAASYEELAHYVQAKGLENVVEVDLTARGIRVTLSDSIAFASGSAELSAEVQEVLGGVAVAAARSAGVEVEGHTDDRPIATAAFPSNWELSAARAGSVVRFLLTTPEALPPSRYQAVGYGEHQPRASNETPEGRARNRRIAILLRSQSDPVPPAGPVSLPDTLQPYPIDVRPAA